MPFTIRRLVHSAIIGGFLNLLALSAASFHAAPALLRIAALFFFVPGLRLCSILGQGPDHCPGYVWFPVNALLTIFVIFFIWALVPLPERPPASVN